MKRLIFMGNHIIEAARILFAKDDRYTSKQIALWPELEVTVHEDGRYAVWVNLVNDADLLQDTRHDDGNFVQKLLPFADEIIED